MSDTRTHLADVSAFFSADRPVTILAGAGLSAPPPTSLPGWWSLNEAVLAALGEAVERMTDRKGLTREFRDVIKQRRDSTPFLKPDLQAQLIEDEIGSAYFQALSNVDSEEANAAHGLLAELARLGRIGAIITTNFDCVIERALESAKVPFRLYSSSEEFDLLPADETELVVVKIHGSATNPDTMVDTMRQRLHGRPKALEKWMLSRFTQFPTVGLGFSCEDLQYDPDYLSIRPACGQKAKFCFLVQSGENPAIPLRSLVSDFPRQVFVCSGTLPQWLFDVAECTDIDHEVPTPLRFSKTEEERRRESTLKKLEDGLADWAASLTRLDAVNAVTALLSSAGYRPYAEGLLRRVWKFYRSPDDCAGPAYARYLHNYGEVLLRKAIFYNPYDREKQFSEWFDVADQDPGQFFFRAVEQGGAENSRARFLLCKFLASEPVSAIADEAESLVAQIVEAGSDEQQMSTTLIDASFSLAELMEMLGLAQWSADLLERTHQSAVQLGDEFRRAEAAWRWARSLAFLAEDNLKNADRAVELAQECSDIAARLDIRESDAGGALARSIAAGARQDWKGAAQEAKAAETIYMELEDTLGVFFAKRELIRTLVGQASVDGQMDGAKFDELSEWLQKFAGEYAPGTVPLVKVDLATLASYFDAELATELATDAANAAELQGHPVIGTKARDLIEKLR